MGFIKGKPVPVMVERITAVAEPLCRSMNFELVHMEYTSRNRETMVRLFLDKPGGITLDDCVAVSRQLGDLIDIQIEDIGSYRLEVSSPGPKRPLIKKEDFIRFAGKRVRVDTHVPVSGQKKFTGTLEKTNDDSVVIAIDGQEVEIPAHTISRAMLAGQ